jgi:hypothetical protein
MNPCQYCTRKNVANPCENNPENCPYDRPIGEGASFKGVYLYRVNGALGCATHYSHQAPPVRGFEYLGQGIISKEDKLLTYAACAVASTLMQCANAPGVRHD